MQIKSYEEAINYLESFVGKVIFRVNKEFLKEHDPLERMRIFLSLLNNPQEKFKSVLVGGTSGKGSTSYLISHILTTAGYKTGFTVSPHLQKINERIQINGKSISDQEFTDLLSSILSSIEGMKRMKVGAPSYFEILVAMAFTYFVEQKVDIAVVEVGMGGEFDATNTLNPLIAVLTNVGLDHTNVLGKTVEKIARTKAGIIKGLRIKDKGLINNSSLIAHHLPVITGIKQSSVIKIVEERCEKVRAKLFRLGKDFKPTNLKLSLLGQYQKENASLAVQTVTQLRKFGFKISEENIKKALSTAFFPGRFEIINYTLDAKRYTLVLDGAHNPTKMKEFLKSLEKLYPEERPTSPRLRGASKVFIVGFKFDKDIPKMLKQITKAADKIIFTEFNRATDMSMHASADAKSIKDELLRINYKNKIIVEKDSKKALEKAIGVSSSEKDSIIIVTGSLYLVGEIRNLLKIA